MGVGKFISCRDCGHEWTHYNGIGMNRGYWYCDRCGSCKEQECDSDLSIPNMNGNCSCGGSFIMEAPEDEIIACPECQSNDLDLGGAVFNWD